MTVTIACKTRVKMSRITPDGTKLKADEFRTLAEFVTGKKRHELNGPVAFAAWLGIHAALMSGVRERVEAFINWAWNYFGKSRPIQVLDRSEEKQIDWQKKCS
jgi:NADH dehydrogenase FAD-containing subunit